MTCRTHASAHACKHARRPRGGLAEGTSARPRQVAGQLRAHWIPAHAALTVGSRRGWAPAPRRPAPCAQELTPWGFDTIHTPHIDKLAESALTFTQAHVQQVCAGSVPARMYRVLIRVPARVLARMLIACCWPACWPTRWSSCLSRAAGGCTVCVPEGALAASRSWVYPRARTEWVGLVPGAWAKGGKVVSGTARHGTALPGRG